MDLNTFQNFFKGSPQDELKAKEQAKELLKKYECFNELLSDKESILDLCQGVILSEAFRNIKSRPEIDRAYMLAMNDTFSYLKKFYNDYKSAYNYLMEVNE